MALVIALGYGGRPGLLGQGSGFAHLAHCGADCSSVLADITRCWFRPASAVDLGGDDGCVEPVFDCQFLVGLASDVGCASGYVTHGL